MDSASVDVRINAGLVFTAAGEEIFGGVVEVSGDTISHVGSKPTEATAVETVEARGQILVPGLVNTHAHTSQQLGRGLADDVDLLRWLRERIWPYESSLNEADSEVSALVCALEQIRNGVTTIADPGGQHVDGMARGLKRSGIRALLGRSSMDEGIGLPAVWNQSTEECLAIQDDLADRWHGAANGRLRMSYTLRTIFNCSDALITESAERGLRLGTPVQMHVAEIREENQHAIATRGVSTIRHLHRLGVLGPGLLAAHLVFVDDEEIGMVAETGTAVSHNPAAAMRVLGFPRIADMLERDILVSIGTDGAPCNNRMSMIDEMWLASLLQKAMRNDPTVLPARQVLRMATIDGARALGWDGEIGSLEPGKKADLALVDPLSVNMTPVHDSVSALVTSRKSENVRSVMCDGRWLLRDRVITVCDEAEVLAEAQVRAEALRPAGVVGFRSLDR